MFTFRSCCKFWLVFLEDMTVLSSSCNFFIFPEESKFYIILKLISEISSSGSFNCNMMDIMVHRVNKKDKEKFYLPNFRKISRETLKKNSHEVDLYKKDINIVIYFCLMMLYIYEITSGLWMQEFPNMNIVTYSQVTIFKQLSYIWCLWKL